MNHFEHYLVDLLQHHITYNNEDVQVRRQFNELEELPCITLSVAGATTEKVYAMKTEDTEEAQYERHATIDINVWCNTEEERESITAQIQERFMKEQSGHYSYCSQYQSNGNCTTLERKCPSINGTSVRQRKGQCSLPDEYGYEALWHKHGLIDGSIKLDAPVMMDEYDKHPPLLRSRISSEASYYDVHSLPTSNVESVEYGVEIR